MFSRLINAGMNDAVITTFESKAILSMIEEFSSGQADVKKISEIVAFDKVNVCIFSIMYVLWVDFYVILNMLIHNVY